MARPHPALIELAAGREVPLVEDPERFVASAVDHRMQGLLWTAVVKDEVELSLALERQLAALDLQTRAHHRRLWDALRTVTRLLAELGIEVATFKGVGAEQQLYERLGERPSRDIDLWLSPHDFDRVTDIMSLLQPDHPLVGSVHRLMSHGHLQSVDITWGDVWIDLHVDPFKLGVSIPGLDGLWARRSELEPGLTMPDLPTSLLQFLLHLNKDRFSWLLGFADVVRVLDREPEAATAAMQLAEQIGMGVPAAKSMGVVSRLTSQRWSSPTTMGWQARVWDRLWPDEIMLQGSQGFLRAHRRQVFIPFFARGLEGAALRSVIRLAVPAPDLVDFYFPDVGGPYPVRLLRGRTRRWLERRRAMGYGTPASVESTRAASKVGPSDDIGESVDRTEPPPPVDQGVFIVIGGPDGVGKTSLARAIIARVGGRGRYFHFIPFFPYRLENSPPDGPAIVEKNRESGSRALGWLRIGRNLMRAWLSYLTAIRPAIRSGAVVVGDRWMYGYLAQPLALKFHGPEWMARLALRLMPQPDLVVLLRAPAEVIRERKAELSVTEIASEIRTWEKIHGPTLRLDATQASTQLAKQLLDHLSLGYRFKRYPPTLGHVLLPARPRSAALAGSTLYTAARTRGLAGQRVGRGMIRVLGTSWLPMADPTDVPLVPDHREALMGLLADHGLHWENIALYTRTQERRPGYSVLVLRDGTPIGFVRVGAHDELLAEVSALELLDAFEPTSFRHPRLLGRASLGDVAFILQTTVLEGFHKPPRRPPLGEIVSEIQNSLKDLPKPPATPDHWVPIHGDLTPWNLRQTGNVLSLVDWESAGWGPPGADQILYDAASIALGHRQPQRAWSHEASAFWLEQVSQAKSSRDARLRRKLLAAIKHGSEKPGLSG